MSWFPTNKKYANTSAGIATPCFPANKKYANTSAGIATPCFPANIASSFIAVKNTLQTLGTVRTIAWRYNRNSVPQGHEEIILSAYKDADNYEIISFGYGMLFDTIIKYRKKVTDTLETVVQSGWILTEDDNWHTIMLTINSTVSHDVIRIYSDGIDRTDYEPAPPNNNAVFSGAQYFIGKSGTVYIGNCSMKDFVIAPSILDPVAFHNGTLDLSTIPTTLWYRMNDADEGAPWTDNIKDSSGNGNHGTPFNINPETFFNRS